VKYLTVIAVLDGPASTLTGGSAQHDDMLVACEQIVHCDTKGSIRHLHELLEKTQNRVDALVVARGRIAAALVPLDVRGEHFIPKRVHIAARERLVSTTDHV
jgi:hypothetical protein